MLRNVCYKKVILFVVGFVGYMLVELAFRQYTYTWSGILGGVSFLLIDSINNTFGFDLDFLIQCIIGSSVITYLELIIGEFAKVNPEVPIMWNYSNMPLNYDGVICLPFSLIWIAMSALAILLADAINYYVLKDDERPYYKIFGKEFLKFKERKN